MMLAENRELRWAMSSQVYLPAVSVPSPSTNDLILDAEEALLALEEIDAHYERERDAIERWPVSVRAKGRMLGRLQAERQAKREALVERMLELRESLQERTLG
jgi:flagellar biosynthesis/type III secretory pathway protein FliH